MADTPLKEGRFRRWSRLKTGGDAEAPDAPAPVSDTGTEAAYAVPDPHAMPGGAAIRRGSLVPAMAALAGEEDDDGTESAAVADKDSETETADEEMPELTAEEAAIVAELPPIDSLTKESDFTPFLADKVPEFIRRRALSVLWRSDPVLANLDGLNDYDENFRIIDTLIDAAKDTVYRVGKGHKTNEEEEAAKADAAAAADGETEAAPAEAGETASGEAGEAAGDEAGADTGGAAAQDADVAAAEDDSAARLSAGSVRKPEERS